jgi:hypothetical protein
MKRAFLNNFISQYSGTEKRKKGADDFIGGRWLFQEYKWFTGKAPESMQSAVFSIVFPKFEYKCHPNHLYAPTAYG